VEMPTVHICTLNTRSVANCLSIPGQYFFSLRMAYSHVKPSTVVIVPAESWFVYYSFHFLEPSEQSIIEAEVF
jgi:hypothetical protein